MTVQLPLAPIAAAAGDGAQAGRLRRAGVDVVVAYHSSALRARGFPSVAGLLPWASANELTLAMVPEVVAGAGDRPVFATVCGTDGLRPAGVMLDRLAAMGVQGVLNAPTVGLLTGPVRRALENSGFGFDREVELMRLARERGMRAWGYACTGSQAGALVRAGAEAVVGHLGITQSRGTDRRADEVQRAGAELDRITRAGAGPDRVTRATARPDRLTQAVRSDQIGHAAVPPDQSGPAGVRSDRIARAAVRLGRIGRAASAVDSGVRLLAHGGPIVEPAVLAEVRAGGSVPWGFFGASVFERAADPVAAVRAWRAVTDPDKEGSG